MKKIKINLSSFDFIKGFLMIVIVIGHSLNYYLPEMINPTGIFGGSALSVFLTLFMLSSNPLFFICSGIGIKEKPAKKLLRSTFSSYIVPYIAVALVTAVLFPLVHYAFFRGINGAISESIRYDLAFLLGVSESGTVSVFGIDLYMCSAVHYLLELFIATNILNLILRVKKEWLRTVICVLCALAGYGLRLAGIVYFCLPAALEAILFCYLGYLIKKHDLINKLLEKLYLIPVILGASALSLFIMTLIPYDYLFRLTGILGITFIMLFAGLMLGSCQARILDPIKSIGMYTFWILCIHSVEMICLPWYMISQKYIPNNPVCAFALEILLKAVIITIGCIVFKQVSKAKYKRRLQNAK